MANLRDKCDRAVIAFIKDAVVSVDADIQVYPCNYSGKRDITNGLVDVITSQGPEDPPFSGNHWMDCKIRISYPGANQPENSDTLTNRVMLGKIVDATFDVLHQSDNNSDYSYTAKQITIKGNALVNDASNGTDPVELQRSIDDADMALFTCLDIRGVNYLGAPEEGAVGNNFIEIMKFQLYAAALGGLN